MTNPIFPEDINLSRPFHFATESQPGGSRIGGNMPEGLVVALTENARYFGTFPLYEGQSALYFSVFINCSFSDLLDALNQGFQSDDRIVVIVHEEKPRSTSPQYASKLSRHTLQIDDVQADVVRSDGGEDVIRDRHKFGGRPFCIQEPTLDGADELFAQGYRQVLQIDFPNLTDGDISGSWPFGDGIFNLFWKYPFENERYYWYLQG